MHIFLLFSAVSREQTGCMSMSCCFFHSFGRFDTIKNRYCFKYISIRYQKGTKVSILLTTLMS